MRMPSSWAGTLRAVPSRLRIEVFEFDVGLVGSGADGFDVDAEEHVAHGGVSDGDELDDLAASDFEGADHLSNLVVDAGDEDGLEFAAEVAGLV